MDDAIANVQCEKCGEWFDVLARNYERTIQEDQPILCTPCFNTIMAEQDKAEIPERRKFEYSYPGAHDIETLNAAGLEGWEVVAVLENEFILLKREIVKGLK